MLLDRGEIRVISKFQCCSVLQKDVLPDLKSHRPLNVSCFLRIGLRVDLFDQERVVGSDTPTCLGTSSFERLLHACLRHSESIDRHRSR
jgi:hypothetical protein